MGVETGWNINLYLWYHIYGCTLVYSKDALVLKLNLPDSTSNEGFFDGLSFDRMKFF